MLDFDREWDILCRVPELREVPRSYTKVHEFLLEIERFAHLLNKEHALYELCISRMCLSVADVH